MDTRNKEISVFLDLVTVACVNIESRKKTRQKIETLIALTLTIKETSEKKTKSALKFVFNTNLGEILWVRFEMV